MSRARQVARALTDLVETNPLWRRVGKRWLVPRLELLPPGSDQRNRWRQIYPDFSGRNNIERTLAHVWIAATARRAWGGLILSPISDGFLLHTMRVPRPFRGLGVGQWLVEQVLERARQRGDTLWLQVRPENRPAVALYRRQGFKEVEPPPPLRRAGHLIMRWS